MRVFMLDQHGCNDKKMQGMCKSSVLMARPWVLYQWFMVLSKVHPQFHDMKLPSYSAMERNVEEASNTIMEEVSFVTDTGRLEREHRIGSDVARVRGVEIRSPAAGGVETGSPAAGGGSCGSSVLDDRPVVGDDCPVDGDDVLGSLRSTFIMPAASTTEITADNYQQARFLMKTAEFMAEGHRAGGLRELRDRTVAGAGDGEPGSLSLIHI